MKKMFIYVSAIGLTIGVVYKFCKKKKKNDIVSEQAVKTEDSELEFERKETLQSSNTTENKHQANKGSAQVVHERHQEAASIMKDAYENIMEDFVEDFSIEKDVNKEQKKKDNIIDEESDSVMKEMDSISEDLDDLLK